MLTSALNVIGLKVADQANFVLMTFQLLILALFVILSITHLVGDSQSLVSTKPFTGDGGFTALAAGAAVAAYSFLGFDAVSTLTEETHDAERNMPRAIVLVALLGGVIFIVVTYFVTLVSPGGTFDNADSLASDIAKTIGGSLFGAFFLTGLIVAQFTSGLAAQAAVARLLYAMGRDGVLPQRVFGLVSERFHTPVFQHRAVRGDRPGGHLPGRGDLDVIHQFRRVHRLHLGQHLGDRLLPAAPRRTAQPVALHRDAGGRAVIDIYLLTQLDSKALILGLSWLGIGHRLPAGADPWADQGATRDDRDRRGRLTATDTSARLDNAQRVVISTREWPSTQSSKTGPTSRYM